MNEQEIVNENNFFRWLEDVMSEKYFRRYNPWIYIDDALWNFPSEGMNRYDVPASKTKSGKVESYYFEIKCEIPSVEGGYYKETVIF